ncbi:MAG: hypothetical protein HYR55_15935 [Acidobacteria bacterium]|nr:hypothetical protein [Acidobacteriota bacterium]MBI3656790.1 hypothetical protein [Acidobacteriota bacterium]
MTTAEIAAYVGAAAWLPQIATWLYNRFIRPPITIIPDKYAEVGFTSYGPIFNVRMAFSSERKDVIIEGFEILLKHEDGDTRTLRWAGLTETFSEITDNAGNRQVVSRDQTPIALKIGTESLVEKFVRFQEPRHHESERPVISELLAHFNFLKRSGDPDYVARTLKSKELYSVQETRQKSFWWKQGRYEATLRLSSPKKFELAHSRYQFVLSPNDIDRLKQNIATLDIDLKNIINSNLPDFSALPVNWNWANVDIKRIEAA